MLFLVQPDCVWRGTHFRVTVHYVHGTRVQYDREQGYIMSMKQGYIMSMEQGYIMTVNKGILCPVHYVHGTTVNKGMLNP